MDTLEEAKEIREMHPESLEESTEKFFAFLSGWFGGPQLYIQQHGHPRLRMRHFPFAIDKKARDAWMLCMRIALAEHIPQKEVRTQIEEAFSKMATHMQNRENK
jgi:hemoglobin